MLLVSENILMNVLHLHNKLPSCLMKQTTNRVCLYKEFIEYPTENYTNKDLFRYFPLLLSLPFRLF